MKKHLKKYYVPHKNNNHLPHILKPSTLRALGIVAVVISLGVFLQAFTLNNVRMLAAILPGVLSDLANQARASENLNSLTVNPLLVKAAQMKADDMALKGYFAHNSPDGRTPWYWFTQAGYQYLYAGENLAVDFTDSIDVNSAWLASPGHRANIVNSNFSEIGIATARGYWNGRETTFVVQMFGKPMPKLDLTNTQSQVSVPSVNNNLTNNNNVQSASAVEIPIKTVVETDLVAVVKRDISEIDFAKEDNTEIIVDNNDKADGSLLGEQRYPSLVARLLTSPKQVLTYAYLAIMGMVAIALILLVGIEMRKEHARHAIYGLVFLLFVVLLWMSMNYWVLPNVRII